MQETETFSETSIGGWKDVPPTLRASGGNVGGGSECLVCIKRQLVPCVRETTKESEISTLTRTN